MEKMILNNRVAVLKSFKYGCGWSTEENDPVKAQEMLFDKELVTAILDDKDIAPILKRKYESFYTQYCNMYLGLEVQWLEIGEKFLVCNYDGAEYIITSDMLCYTA